MPINAFTLTGNVYFSGTNDSVKRFVLNQLTSKLTTTPADKSVDVFGFPGSEPVVSANKNGSGILWAVEKRSSASILHAYDATNLSHEFYNSNQNSARDALGISMKFAPPLVINGKVNVGTRTSLVVYGNF